MPSFKEVADAYSAPPTIAFDLNVIPSSYTLIPGVQGTPLNIHRGAQRAKEDVFALGIDPNLGAMGYFPLAALSWLRQGVLLLTPYDEVWRVISTPARHSRFAATTHIACLLQRLNTRPSGLPSLESEAACSG